MNWAYLLKCGDGSYYAGWTTDLEKRLKTHGEGKGGKYTRSRLPISLAWAAQFETRSEAMREECRLKTLSHAEKQALAEKFNRQ